MTGKVDSVERTLAVRPETLPSVLVNSLVSRGLQELPSLTALPAGSLLAAEDIFTAAMNGDVAAVRLILANDPEQVNARDSADFTPLHYAATRGHTSVVELLLDRGADINAGKGETPLHYAAGSGHTSVVELLLDHGADIHAHADETGTPLHYAAKEGYTSVVELLLARGADIKASDSEGLTPLHLAAILGHTSVVELLLVRGADIKARTKVGGTPLHCAAEHGNSAVVEVLVSSGADIEASDCEGQTPLHYAALFAHQTPCAEPWRHHSPSDLHYAALFGHQTPEALAGRKSVVELLLARGADIEARAEGGRTALHIAAEHPKRDVVLPLGSEDIVAKHHRDVVEVLLSWGAEVDGEDDQGHTPLYLAAQEDHTDIVELLLHAGARPVARDGS